MAQITLEELIDLAFSVEDGDNIDWSMFSEGKEAVMKLLATSVLDHFNKDQYTEDDLLVMMASITKLLAENMVLQSQLMRLRQQNEM